MRAPFTYYGGKIGLAERIVQLFPPHRVYMEPFAGSLAVLFEKAPAGIEIVNDVDAAIVAFFACLRDRPADLERACRLTPYARDEFKLCADLDDPGLVPAAHDARAGRGEVPRSRPDPRAVRSRQLAHAERTPGLTRQPRPRPERPDVDLVPG